MVPQISLSAGSPLRWQVEGKPVSVHLDRAVMADLRARALSANSMEFGGLLLGRSERSGEGFVTRIQAFEPFDLEQRYGPSYVLLGKDRERLRSRMLRAARGGMQPVGMCRGHLRRDLYLDKRDFTTFQLCFPDPASVFLLVKSENGSPRGALFIWEEGDIRRHTSYAEFPLERPAAPEPAPESRPRLTRTAAAVAVLATALPVGAYFAGRAVALRRPIPAAVVSPQAQVTAEVLPRTGLPLNAGELYVPPAAERKVLPQVPSGIKVAQPPAVTLAVRVDAQGRAVEVVTHAGDGPFAEAAAAAVRQWVFTPARLNSIPVASDVFVRFVFRNP